MSGRQGAPEAPAAPELYPLVGAFWRPPAKQLLGKLPLGAPLRLQAEPENPYDSLAIQVWGSPSSIPEDLRAEAREEFLLCGADLDEMLQSGESIQLGYIGASEGKICRAKGWDGNKELYQRGLVQEGSLGLMPDGSVGVQITRKDSEECRIQK